MAAKVILSKAEARRALVNTLLKRGTIDEVFDRLRCVQFDPLSPIGCNHDLVLRARVPKYKIGDWQKAAYKNRTIYDGWDKQACLITVEGWPLRRVVHSWSDGWQKIVDSYPEAVEAIISELRDKGPLEPRQLEFQLKRDDWKGSWYGTSLTKRVLRGLWHTGRVMTHSRRAQNHLYALTEDVLPSHIPRDSNMASDEALREIVFDRVVGMGFLRPNAPSEIWAMSEVLKKRKQALNELADAGRIGEVDIEGVIGYASPLFLAALEEDVYQRVEFIAPLDQLLWDRKVVHHVFDFKYLWEVYVPAAKRQWGYYVLPVLYGDQFVARAELWARKGVLEIREWHWEGKPKLTGFWPELRKTAKSLHRYASTTSVKAAEKIDPRVVKAFELS